MIEGLIGLIIALIIVGIVCGLVVWLIRAAPFIPEPFKSWAEYLVYVVAVLVILVRALPLIGVSL
jgi:branched-subunit amino acid transport protein